MCGGQSPETDLARTFEDPVNNRRETPFEMKWVWLL
jgi:hypothetical protein